MALPFQLFFFSEYTSSRTTAKNLYGLSIFFQTVQRQPKIDKNYWKMFWDALSFAFSGNFLGLNMIQYHLRFFRKYGWRQQNCWKLDSFPILHQKVSRLLKRNIKDQYICISAYFGLKMKYCHLYFSIENMPGAEQFQKTWFFNVSLVRFKAPENGWRWLKILFWDIFAFS